MRRDVHPFGWRSNARPDDLMTHDLQYMLGYRAQAPSLTPSSHIAERPTDLSRLNSCRFLRCCFFGLVDAASIAVGATAVAGRRPTAQDTSTDQHGRVLISSCITAHGHTVSFPCNEGNKIWLEHRIRECVLAMHTYIYGRCWPVRYI